MTTQTQITNGSAKQIAWAENMVAQHVENAAKIVAYLETMKDGGNVDPYLKAQPEEIEYAIFMIEKRSNEIASMDDAKAIIDIRKELYEIYGGDWSEKNTKFAANNALNLANRFLPDSSFTQKNMDNLHVSLEEAKETAAKYRYAGHGDVWACEQLIQAANWAREHGYAQF